MLMAEDGAAHNWKVCVGADEIVRQHCHKIQQLLKAGPVNAHRRMLRAQADAVLIVIHIGRILQIPAFAAERHGNEAVILPRRMVHPSGVALIFRAELALWIPGLRRELCRRNGARVLLWLREVDRDIQRTVLSLVDPLLILCNAVAADIIRILTEFIEPVRRLPRAFVIQRTEFFAHLVRCGRQGAHQLRIKEVARDLIVRADAARHGFLRQPLQEHMQRLPLRLRRLDRIQPHDLQQPVDGPCPVVLLQKPAADRIVRQSVDRSVHLQASNTAPPASRMESTWQLPLPITRSKPARNASS